jgi:hypothetical protein
MALSTICILHMLHILHIMTTRLIACFYQIHFRTLKTLCNAMGMYPRYVRVYRLKITRADKHLLWIIKRDHRVFTRIKRIFAESFTSRLRGLTIKEYKHMMKVLFNQMCSNVFVLNLTKHESYNLRHGSQIMVQFDHLDATDILRSCRVHPRYIFYESKIDTVRSTRLLETTVCLHPEVLNFESYKSNNEDSIETLSQKKYFTQFFNIERCYSEHCREIRSSKINPFQWNHF